MNKRVLLVEDNQVNRYLASYLLAQAGHDVEEVDNGALAIEAAHRRPPDLILMDIQMPVMDGFEATRRLKADPRLRHVPIVALSAHNMPQDRARSLAAGCDDHIGKPIDVATFLDRLRPYLRGGAGA